MEVIPKVAWHLQAFWNAVVGELAEPYWTWNTGMLAARAGAYWPHSPYWMQFLRGRGARDGEGGRRP